MIQGVRTFVRGGLRELVVRPATQLPGLDALRSAAILLVLGTHWSQVFYPEVGGSPTPLQNFPLFYYGWTGVDLFFVLSGFLIGKQLWRELDATGTIRIGRFLLRRGLRIWPLYFAMLIYFAVFNPAVNPTLADWTFLSNYFPAGVGQTWSLSTEEQFYIAVPLLLLLLRKRLGLGNYVWVLLGIEALVLIFRASVLRDLAARGIAYTDGNDYRVVYPFHTHLEGLLVGLLIALLSVVRPTWLSRRSPRGVAWFAMAVMVGAGLTAVALRTYDQRLFAFVTLGLIFGGITFFILSDRSLLTKPLSWWGFYPISRLSYGMYLNHGWALPFTNKWAFQIAGTLTSQREAVFLIGLALMTLVSIGFAVVTFIVIEHPFLVLRERWIASQRGTAEHGGATAAA